MKSQTKTTLFWLFIVLIGHIIYVNTPWVNLESAFAEASRTLLDPNHKLGIKFYWYAQGNPLGFSLISSIINLIFKLPVNYWSNRLPSLLGICLFIISSNIFFKQQTKEQNLKHFFYLSITLLCPIIWIFSGRGTADILPMCLLFTALASLIKFKNSTKGLLISSFIYGLSIIVKYHTLAFIPGFWFIIYLQNNKDIKKTITQIIIFTLPAIIILLSYISTIYLRFDVFVTPDYFKNKHAFNLSNFLVSLPKYTFYLPILLGPISLLSPYHLFKTKQYKLIISGLAIGSLLFTCTLLTKMSEFSEMNYGFFDSILGEKITHLLNLAGNIIFGLILTDIIKQAVSKKNIYSIFILLTAIPYMLAISTSIPIQRYLIFVIPMFAYFLICYRLNLKSNINKLLIFSTILIFVTANIFSVLFQISQGTAAEKMSQFIIKNKIEKDVEICQLGLHCSQYFLENYFEKPEYYKYIIK
ncbi:hypothetical protein KKC59_04515, partial [bacterium]|nr:hypothetical protein [bacterium]